ncbi:hypothetical protein H0G86_000478 [Trichoderma simmonsii]|uniref:Uncharacterized protein n=1 Tax=Trichoderma simmonsii TaxID=1491479 RepID=A0A8G0L1X8_9HYPO|nr:hypothetical protein H0G86_000478 [Trichoderma simmonsii]
MPRGQYVESSDYRSGSRKKSSGRSSYSSSSRPCTSSVRPNYWRCVRPTPSALFSPTTVTNVFAVQVLRWLVQLPDQRFLPNVPVLALRQLRILHELEPTKISSSFERSGPLLYYDMFLYSS